MKIKKICRLLSLLCLLTAGILFQTQPVKAVQAGQQSYDSDKKGSIQVCLDDIGTDRSLVSLYCYKVGSPKLYENNLEGWTVQETFESLNLDFNHLGDTEVHRESARKLVAFIEENGKIWCCIIKVDTLFSRILIYNHNQYENRRKTYGTESKIL